MILVVGAGVAGISCAIQAAQAGADVVLVTPGSLLLEQLEISATTLSGGNTALAQGGIAAAIGATDSVAAHTTDTVVAGAGLVDRVAAEQLTQRGAAAVRALIAGGFGVDRDVRGEVTFGLEAAHDRPRIVHAGEDRTGAALHVFLRASLAEARLSGRIEVAEHTSVVELLEDTGRVTGAVLRNASGELSAVLADAVVLATGGYAALYPSTSNHSGARGEGVVLASRVGAVVADLEFVQFHPTVLAGTGLLISEALRGAGAVLRGESGERFMLSAHEAAELAPRDVVARTVHREMRRASAAQVWLDATGIERAEGAGTLARRFPAIDSAIRAHGIDWSKDPVPVAPAAHYSMGGLVTDLDGRTSVPGLFAAGEVAATGVHGANRLASNSLLEGLVFGPLAGAAAVRYAAAGASRWELRGAGAAQLIAEATAFSVGSESSATRIEKLEGNAVTDLDLAKELEELAARGSTSSAALSSEEMQTNTPGAEWLRLAASDDEIVATVGAHLGIERDAHGIAEVAKCAAGAEGPVASLAAMIAESAIQRTESRGAHQRSDFPGTDASQCRRRAWAPNRSARVPRPSFEAVPGASLTITPEKVR